MNRPWRPLVRDGPGNGAAMDKCDLSVKCGRVVIGDEVVPLAMGISDGRIAVLSEHDRRIPAEREIDYGDLVIMPGVIDPHVHFKEPGPRSHREDWESGSRQAAAGGVTTVIEMPLSVPLTVDKNGFDLKVAVASKKSLVDFALWGGMNRFAEGHYREMHDLGCVAFKVFLSTDPDSPRLDDHEFLEALRDVAAFGGLVGVHAENGGIIDAMCEKLEKDGRTDGMAHKDSRPDVAEVEAAQRALLFAQETGCRMHICHLSAARCRDAILWYKERGVDATVETCPSYLALDDGDLTRCGAHAKCNPPIREKENREALWRMIFAGEIDMIGSDHSPYLDEDREGGIWASPPGLSGIDLMLPLLLDEGVNRRGLTLPALSRLLSGNVASRFGLSPRKGAIRIGADADFVVVSPETEWTWSWTQSLGKSGSRLTPYEGRRLRGKVMATYVRGGQVYDGEGNRTLVEPGYGEFVRPPAARE